MDAPGNSSCCKRDLRTVHASNHQNYVESYKLSEAAHDDAIVTGIAVGEKIGQGAVHVLSDPSQLTEFQAGLGAGNLDDRSRLGADHEKAAAIVTDRGGRTCHSAIISRELGLPCIVGTADATQKLQMGMEVTVCCAEEERRAISTMDLSVSPSTAELSAKNNDRARKL